MPRATLPAIQAKWPCDYCNDFRHFQWRLGAGISVSEMKGGTAGLAEIAFLRRPEKKRTKLLKITQAQDPKPKTFTLRPLTLNPKPLCVVIRTSLPGVVRTFWTSSLTGLLTLPESNMETQKGRYKDYSPFKGGLYGVPC